MKVYRLAAETPDYAADDLSGGGAATTGGRWNLKGVPVVYAAASIALAYLETLVHLANGPPPRNRYLIEIDIPTLIWQKRRDARKEGSLPSAWDAHPPGRGSIDYGSAWLASAAETLLIVPSVIIPAEDNVLLNPRHSDASKVRAKNLGQVDYDYRLFR